MKKIALWLALAAALIAPSAAYAQVCPAVAALPDSERRVAYAPAASTGPFSVTFALLGDGTDYGAWAEVWLNGVMLTPVTDWQLTIPSGTLSTACRPITNASITLTAAATGTLQIVGARRPRRTSQFPENAGVSARNLNQVITDLTAQSRETWDKINDVTGRAVIGLPGETITTLAPAATRASKFFVWDSFGNPALTSPTPGLGNVLGPGSSTLGHIAVWNNGTGTLLADGGVLSGQPISGLACDGTTDDRPLIQAAIDSAVAGATVVIPASANGCLVTENGSNGYALLVNKPLIIRGQGGGDKACIRPAAAIGATVDTVKFLLTAPAAMAGSGLRDVCLGNPTNGTRAGRHGLYIDTTAVGHNFQGFVVDRVQIFPSGTNNAIRHVNNPTNNTNGGLYHSQFTNSVLNGGIYLDKSGDSITIAYNIFSGAGIGVYADLVATPGPAGNLLIKGNNCTAQAGCVVIDQAISPIIAYNIFEQTLASTEVNTSIISLRGTTAAISAAQVIGNEIHSLGGIGTPTFVRVGSAAGTVIDGNRFATPTAYVPVIITAGATGTIWGPGNSCVGCSALFTDSGTASLQPTVTALTTITNGVYYNAGGSSITTTAAMTDNQLVFGRTGLAPLPRTVSGDITFAAGVATIATNIVTNAKAAQMAANTVKGNFTGSTANAADNTGTADQVLRFSGATALGFGAVDISKSAAITGLLPIANGGCNSATGCIAVVKQQKFTASGTYTPSAGLKYAIIEGVAGGGGGAGAAASAGGTTAGGGGGGGSYCRTVASAATIGASQTVTIGTGGAGGATGANNGSNGVATSVGTICTTNPGIGGVQNGAGIAGQGGAGGSGATGDLVIPGSGGTNGIGGSITTITGQGGQGGASHLGAQCQAATIAASAANGNVGSSFGGGGCGGGVNASASTASGGNGAPGVVFITEFTNQ